MGNQPDQLQPRALCTLMDVARRVPGYDPGEDGETDEILNDLIVQESRDFVEETRREIVAKNDLTTRVFEIDWITIEERELFIGDAATVTQVVIRQQDGTIVQTLQPASWTEDPRPESREDWEPITSLNFPLLIVTPATLWFGTVAEVTGSWGFPAIPDTVRRAVSTFVIQRYITDVAAAGTRFAELAGQPSYDLTNALAAAFDVRRRLRLTQVG